MKFKRAAAIVFLLKDDSLIAYNFIDHVSCVISTKILDLLISLSNWESIESIKSRGNFEPAELPKLLLLLLESGFIVAEGTQQSLRDTEYNELWEWGITAGLFHFSIKNAKWVDQHKSNQFIELRFDSKKPPPFFEDHSREPGAITLSRNVNRDELLALMARRRSCREFSRKDCLDIEVLSDCLFAGLGITEVCGVPPLGPYPLKMTPSGGARNPYDTIVYVRAVTSLNPGLYRYSPFTHSLIKFGNGYIPSIVDILAGQTWAEDAAVIIFLIAQFERTMWKYPHPGAYRVVMIEAGHIAQNIVLAATKNNVKSVTTAAINDELAEEKFRITNITQSVCYAVALGMPHREA